MRATQRTRWLLVAPLAGLALIVAGVWWLEAIHPQLDTDPMVVDDVPPLALTEVRHCIRGVDESAVDAVGEQLPSGGRVSSEQVLACPKAFDGRNVSFAGEVVGDLLVRRGGVWVQVNDDAYALEVGPVIGHREHAGFNRGLAVWLPDGLHERITDVGRPAQRGDVVLVTGTLLRADPDDGGGITVRADSLEVLATAVEIDPPLHTTQVVVAVVLAVLAVASLAWARVRRLRV